MLKRLIQLAKVLAYNSGAGLLCLFISQTAQADVTDGVVTSGTPLVFPKDHGSHPSFKTEWWYVTGQLQSESGERLGFQVTFFRTRTGLGNDNPSRFAPKELLIGHAALTSANPAHLYHAQRTARTGFGQVATESSDTHIRLDDWSMLRNANGSYAVHAEGGEFSVNLTLTPTQPLMLQGVNGYSSKSPDGRHASYYYSAPQLRAEGQIMREGRLLQTKGRAWLDHEWFGQYVMQDAAGWDWLGANFDDGSALMAFRIRSTAGTTLWSYAQLRDEHGQPHHFDTAQVNFSPRRLWTSPRSKAHYPVVSTISVGGQRWETAPLIDDQEIDASHSTGFRYWEGAVELRQQFGERTRRVGEAYLELTGYDGILTL